ncbi:dienelactone hydrolase family protein [Herbaspirillum sp. GCM10030257]|uniref:dienelactone hydrolase family protein n=1 Tax=Herbaspirillum sp. GCM10030257 TaxID=3273393 RepID=UPI003612764D
MQSETIVISGDFHGFVVKSDKPNAPGLLLIQEIFGVNANMRQVAHDYAALGYTVLVPDLFWRTAPGIDLDPAVPADRERAMELNKAFDDATGIADLREAAQLLRTQLTPGQKVGAVGYCLGGRLAFRLAAEKTVDAAVSYYGVNIHGFLQEAKKPSPLLIHVAGADYLCPPDAQEAIRRAFADVPSVEVRHYDGAGHGFARAHSQHYSASAATSAGEATSKFLMRNLNEEG